MAVEMFIKIDTIDGEAQDAKHKFSPNRTEKSWKPRYIHWFMRAKVEENHG
jgi:hypothetical protein